MERLVVASESLTSLVDPVWKGLLKWLKKHSSGRVVVGVAVCLLARKPLDVFWRTVRGYPSGTIGVVPLLSTLRLFGLAKEAELAAVGSYGPVSMHYVGFKPIVLVNSMSALRDSMVDGKLTSRFQPMGAALVRKHQAIWDPLVGRHPFVDADEQCKWSFRRKLFQNTFTNLMDRSFLNEVISDYFMGILKLKLPQGGVWRSMREDLSLLAYNTAFCCSFGADFHVTEDDMLTFRSSLIAGIKVKPLNVFACFFPIWLQEPVFKAMKSQLQVDDVLLAFRMVRQWLRTYKKTQSPPTSPSSTDADDGHGGFYVDRMAAVIDEGALHEKDAVADIVAMFAAATFTTSTSIEQIAANAARYPHYQKQVANELRIAFGDVSDISLYALKKLPYFLAFVYETLRLTPVVRATAHRYVPSKLKVKGYTIPKGATLFGNVLAINRDAAVFGEKPSEFAPRRWLQNGEFDHAMRKELATFGVGKRDCAGRQLGLNQLMLVAAYLLLDCRFEAPSGEPKEIKSLGYHQYHADVTQNPLRVTPRNWPRHIESL